MFVIKTIKIRSYQMGLYFRDGEFRGLLGEGRHWLFDPLCKDRVDVVSMRDAWLVHDKLDMIVKSGALVDRAVVLDLKDYQRGLVWVEGRFSHVHVPRLRGHARNAGQACPRKRGAWHPQHRNKPYFCAAVHAGRVLALRSSSYRAANFCSRATTSGSASARLFASLMSARRS